MINKAILLALVFVVAVVVAQEQKWYTGEEDHSVTRAEAAAFTRTFREAHPDAPEAFYFGRKAFESILAQQGVVGIRIYNGITEDGKHNRVMVGVDSQGNDIVDGVLAERALSCPPSCGQQNAFEMMSDK